jgi:predicted membrane protein
MSTPYRNNRRSGKVWVGFILLVIGFILLINTLGFYIPDWVISWPMFLIIIGIAYGQRHTFRHPAAVILILIGGLFLLERIVPRFDFGNFVWPVAIILFGLYLIVGRNRRISSYRTDPGNLSWDKRVDQEGEIDSNDIPPVSPPASDDFIDTVSVFGGIKKNIMSKNFRGGEIVTIMGGAEINLTRADFTGTVVLEVVQIFGGTKIILPPHWKVSSEMAAIFGGIEDKRMISADQMQSDKVLIIKGTSIFGGVTMHSY